MCMFVKLRRCCDLKNSLPSTQSGLVRKITGQGTDACAQPDRSGTVLLSLGPPSLRGLPQDRPVGMEHIGSPVLAACPAATVRTGYAGRIGLGEGEMGRLTFFVLFLMRGPIPLEAIRAVFMIPSAVATAVRSGWSPARWLALAAGGAFLKGSKS